MKIKSMRLLMFVAAFAALIVPATAQKFLDTQYGQDGMEVHLLKASVANKVLTVAFMFDNSTGERVSMPSMDVEGVAYTTADKKYPVLRDADGGYLASTFTDNSDPKDPNRYILKDGFLFVTRPNKNVTVDIRAGKKVVGWVKFEAPADDQWPIEVSLPGVSPFTIEKP